MTTHSKRRGGRIEILVRSDSHYYAPEVLRFCRANRVDFVPGVATTSTLRRHILGLEQSTAKRFAGAGGRDKIRRFKEFYDVARSWDRVERIIARVEVGPEGVDTRFITTSLAGSSLRAVYEKTYRIPHVSRDVRSHVGGGGLDTWSLFDRLT